MPSRPALRAVALTCLLVVAPCGSASEVQPRRAWAPSSQAETYFYCPMHPEVRSSREGKCPLCGMTLTAARRPAKTPSVSPQGGAEPVARALEIPDVPVSDQNGRRLNFYSDLIKHKTVAIDFIFTSCTTICPALTATMSSVQRQLAGAGIQRQTAQAGVERQTPEPASRDVQLISITVDPATDTPVRLKSFADKFNVAPGWSFVTGAKPDIDRLLRALGAYVSDPSSHSPLILIGNDEAGYWTRCYGLASPAAIKDLILEAASKSSTANAVQ